MENYGTQWKTKYKKEKKVIQLLSSIYDKKTTVKGKSTMLFYLQSYC